MRGGIKYGFCLWGIFMAIMLVWFVLTGGELDSEVDSAVGIVSFLASAYLTDGLFRE